MALVNYYQIQEDLAALLHTGPSEGWQHQPNNILIEAMDREMTFDAMPLINIRLTDGEIEVRSLPNGYFAEITYELDVISFDLSEFRKASIVRDEILGDAQLTIQRNSRFNSDILTSTITPTIKFGAGTPEGAGGHIAVGTFTVVVEVEIDAA